MTNVRAMSSRATIIAVVLAALLGSGVGATATVFVVKRGSAAHRGVAGPPGPRGPEGNTQVDTTAVQAAIDKIRTPSLRR